MVEYPGTTIDAVALKELERNERERRARWSHATWMQVVERSIPKLARQLEALEPAESKIILTTYLALIAEAIAHQLLYPHPEGEYPNIYSAVFERLIPERLGSVSGAKEKADVLAKLWNLCDAVSQEPPWVEASMAESLLSLEALTDLQERCRTLQKDLVHPRPQLVNGSTSPEALSYVSISLWPIGFFLPERVARCGPNVFLVSGQSPGAPRSFYVLLRSAPRIIPAAPGDTKAEENDSINDDDRRIRDLLGKVAPFDLTLRSFAVAESGIVAAYSESQLVHIWQVSQQ